MDKSNTDTKTKLKTNYKKNVDDMQDHKKHVGKKYETFLKST